MSSCFLAAHEAYMLRVQALGYDAKEQVVMSLAFEEGWKARGGVGRQEASVPPLTLRDALPRECWSKDACPSGFGKLSGPQCRACSERDDRALVFWGQVMPWPVPA